MPLAARPCRATAAALFGLLQLAAAPGDPAPVPYSGNILHTAAFVAAEGVTTHIAYNDGGYADLGEVIRELKYLGIDRVREGVNAPGINGGPSLQAYWSVARAGIKFDFVVSGGSFGRTSGSWASPSLEERIDNIHWMQRAEPGCVIAIEGPNEINNEPIVYEGLGKSKTGADELAAALALQRDLYRAVRSDDRLKSVPIYYFTGYGVGSIPNGPDPGAEPGLADFNNQHPYPRNGEPPAAWVARRQAFTNGLQGAAVFSETGYSTDTASWHGVPEDVQARYTLDLLLDAAKEGIAATYLYELMDAYAPGSRQHDAGYGLFDYRHNPKPVALALRNMNAILRDPAADALSFPIEPLHFTTRSPSPSTRVLLMQASGSRYVVALWDEQPLLKGPKGARIVPAKFDVDLNLPQSFDITVFDPFAGQAPIRSVPSATSVSIALSDHPVFVFLDTAKAAPGHP